MRSSISPYAARVGRAGVMGDCTSRTGSPARVYSIVHGRARLRDAWLFRSRGGVCARAHARPRRRRDRASGEHGISVVVEAVGETQVRLIGRARGRTTVLEGPLEGIDRLTNQLATRLAALFLDEGREALRSKTRASVTTRGRPSPPGSASDRAPKDREAHPLSTPPPPVSVPAPPPPEPAPAAERRPAFFHNRVVAHAFPDAPSSWPGSGKIATQALYHLLSDRFRLSIVPMGVGISAPLVAGDEGAHMQARAVIMGRYLVIDYIPASFGVAVRVRLEIEVVVEGRVVFKRLAESAAQTLPEATTAALNSIGSELRVAMGDLQGG